MIENPHLLPKIRSEALRQSAIDMPCTLRIAGFIGLPCSSRMTNVMAHLPVHGKGVATKVSDLHMVCGCRVCHDLLDYERDPRGAAIREKYPHAFWERLFKAHAETLSRWVALGLIPMGEDWEVV
jgi:hypothetical protein